MITGFDSDTLDAFARMYAFLQAAGIPMVLLAMLNALDGTPLQRRLADEGRLKRLLLVGRHARHQYRPQADDQPGALKGTLWLLNRLYAPDAFLARLDVFAAHLPLLSNMAVGEPLGADPTFWERLAASYARLGPDLHDVPLRAARLFRGRDAYGVKTSLVFYRSAVGVMRRLGIWNPRLAALAEPDFRRAA